ncbi:hypothetical protein Hte_011866 [Hypoxylon texense]
MSLEKEGVEDVEVFHTKEDAGASDSAPRVKKWLDKCFARVERIGERLLACGSYFGELPRPCHFIRKKFNKAKNRKASENFNQDRDAGFQTLPATTRKRTTVQELTGGDRRGTVTIQLRASRISSFELKQYLEREYPDQYNVQLKRDVFTITIDPSKQPQKRVVSRVPWYLKAMGYCRPKEQKAERR